MDHVEFKTLPVECKWGTIPGHAWHAPLFGPAPAIPQLSRRHATHVVFKTFNEAAGCPLEIVVHVSHLTKYMARSWPGFGEIVSVLMDDGTRRWAKSYSAHFNSDREWRAALPIMRLPFTIRGLCSNELLLELAGGHAWCISERRPEDAGLILDPWARDNAAFHARMAQLQAHPQI